MKSIYEDVINTILGILLFLVVFWTFCSGNIEVNELKKSGLVTEALITKYSYKYKRGGTLDYHFKVKNKYYSDNSSFFGVKNVEYLVGMKVPVIYSPNDPNNNVLLIRKVTFDMYKLKYPDSLKRINDSLKISD
jgi:hypothetical protein